MTQTVERVRWISRVRVLRVQEERRQINWRKDPETGQTMCDEELTGLWSVHLADGATLLFPERPDGLVEGGMLRMTMEMEP